MMQLYQFSKKIHRFFVLLIILLSFFMMITGIMMKYEVELRHFMPVSNFITARIWHNLVSIYFVIVLFLQLLTGLVLYYFPIWSKNRAPKPSLQKTPTVN